MVAAKPGLRKRLGEFFLSVHLIKAFQHVGDPSPVEKIFTVMRSVKAPTTCCDRKVFIKSDTCDQHQIYYSWFFKELYKKEKFLIFLIHLFFVDLG